MKIVPVIMSGGSGTRLWPLSRAMMPKQFLKLVSDNTMLQDTLLRLTSCPDVADPIIVCGNEHRFLVAEQLRQIEINPAAIILEPIARNTAPAIAAAAMHLADPEDVMLVLPADHIIQNVSAFIEAILTASQAAANGRLVTFGVVPSYPETGFGYIQAGSEMVDISGCHQVVRFVEKPDSAHAQTFMNDGHYFWNSGIFLFKPETYLQELQKYAPDIHAGVLQSVASSIPDLDFIRLDEAALVNTPSNSIDYAVMEHTSLAVVVPVDMQWSDVGSWGALSAVQAPDASGNVVRGDVILQDVSGAMVRSESRLVAVIGLEDIVVVETSDAVLVTHKQRTQDVKSVVETLKTHGRLEHVEHARVYRPWGWYESIDRGERFQVKRIMVKPGEKLSMQLHHHRAEHWVVVSGCALVTVGNEQKLYAENESTYIPIGTVHRLENPGKMPLHLIEVQSGSYLGEDDIVRFNDTYGRV